MAHAAMRAGRDPLGVELVAVTKTVGVEKVREAYEAGLRAFGESRVREAQGKAAEIIPWADGAPVRWHMVGRLQKNKARAAIRLFDLIHSVDSVELLGLIDRIAGEEGKLQRVLLQMKVSDEPTKSGAGEDEVRAMHRAALGMRNVRVEGLMCIPPFLDDPALARPYYRRLREVAGSLGLSGLSMGMTHDYETAIEEGATMVRVGTAIFGERN
jgi:hypothetical protein